jgi:hypothetical protein
LATENAELKRQLAALQAASAVAVGPRSVAAKEITNSTVLTGNRNIGSVEQLRIESAIFFGSAFPGAS